MSKTHSKFDNSVWCTVTAIPSGRVMSYGEVARASGYPRHARMVSKAMQRSPVPLPWHRVVRSDRTLAFKPGSESYNKQRSLLEKEGVRFINGKVMVPASAAAKNLDELIWGPQD